MTSNKIFNPVFLPVTFGIKIIPTSSCDEEDKVPCDVGRALRPGFGHS